MLPAIITLEDDKNAARFVIAAVAALVIIGSVIWSSRKTESMLAPVSAPRVGATVAGRRR